MQTPSVGAVAVLGASALLAAGCGGSKSSTTSSAASHAPSSTSPQSPSSTTTSAASGSGTTITVKHASKLGVVLAAGPQRMTVYLFEADRGAASKCAGACVGTWPPVTTSGAPVASGSAMAADLGTTKRSDGTMQVTYNGHPLYFFVRDKDSGDSYGQGVHGFGSSWYVLSPHGSKIDNS